jgi:hypothetical protein
MTHLSICPLREDDIPYIVSYWFENSDANLIQKGADKTELNSRTEFANSLQTVCNTPLDKAKSYYMTWLIDDMPIGYNALKDIVKIDYPHVCWKNLFLNISLYVSVSEIYF